MRGNQWDALPALVTRADRHDLAVDGEVDCGDRDGCAQHDRRQRHGEGPVDHREQSTDLFGVIVED
jgi:hypothetical protein